MMYLLAVTIAFVAMGVPLTSAGDDNNSTHRPDVPEGYFPIRRHRRQVLLESLEEKDVTNGTYIPVIPDGQIPLKRSLYPDSLSFLSIGEDGRIDMPHYGGEVERAGKCNKYNVFFSFLMPVFFLFFLQWISPFFFWKSMAL